MVLLIAVGTIIQMIHHKNLTYFFNNAKKAKLAATKKLGLEKKQQLLQKQQLLILEQHQNLDLEKEG